MEGLQSKRRYVLPGIGKYITIVMTIVNIRSGNEDYQGLRI